MSWFHVRIGIYLLAFAAGVIDDNDSSRWAEVWDASPAFVAIVGITVCCLSYALIPIFMVLASSHRGPFVFPTHRLVPFSFSQPLLALHTAAFVIISASVGMILRSPFSETDGLVEGIAMLVFGVNSVAALYLCRRLFPAKFAREVS